MNSSSVEFVYLVQGFRYNSWVFI